MPDLSSIAIENQRHPAIAPDNPFDIAWEYYPGAAREYLGDMHYALQIGICILGEVEVLFDGFSRRYQPGELWWTMCWEPHAHRPAGRRNFTVAVNLELDSLGELDPFGDCNWLLPFTLPPPQRYLPSGAAERAGTVNLARKLFHFCHHRGVLWRQQSWLLITELLLKAVVELTKRSAAEPENAQFESNTFLRLRPAIALAMTPGAANLSLADAARACSLSPSRFSELFRLAMGASFGQFAARARIGQASRMLLKSNLTVEEIAQHWGFFDSSHFCHVFKKFYQATPREFRDRKLSYKSR